MSTSQLGMACPAVRHCSFNSHRSFQPLVYVGDIAMMCHFLLGKLATACLLQRLCNTLCVPLQFREVGDQVLMHVNPSLPGIPSAITKYTEYYNKDQSPNSWAMRRDIRVGKTVGQMFSTTDGLLILR